MKLKIRAKKVRLFFVLPLSFVKSRLALKIATKAVEDVKKNTKARLPKESAQEQTTAWVDVANQSDSVALRCQSQSGGKPQGCKDGSDIPVVSRDFLKQLYDALKTIVKQQGHFTLLEVVGDKGKSKVKIDI